MRVLLDTNIILDFFLERDPFYDLASQIFNAIADERLSGFVSASSVTDIFYICRRQTQSVEEAQDITQTTLMLLNVCSVNDLILNAALNSEMVDFEDAVQAACAQFHGIDAIVTRNVDDFISTDIKILSPEQLIINSKISDS